LVAFALLVTLVPNTAQAQLWTFRANAGLSNSNFYGGDKLLGDEDRNAFAAGITADYKRELGDAWSFEFQIYYVQKGAKGNIEYNPVDPEQPPIDYTFEGEVKLDYLEFTLAFVGHLETSRDSELRVYLGPGLSNLLSARAEGTLDGDPADYDIKDALNSTEVVVVAGLGWSYYWEKVGVTVDFRNVIGATSIVGDDFPNDLKTRNHELLVGIAVPIAMGE
jgi:hypothetical protein